MMTTELLQQLEAAHRGELDAAAQQALSANIDALPEGSTDAAAYTQIWAGFDALRAATVRQTFDNTEQSLRTYDDQELATWYADDQLHPANRQAVEVRMATDSAFAAIIEQQTKLTDGFNALKVEALKSQMQTWEAAAPSTPKVRQLASYNRRWWAAAAAILLLIVGGYWYQQGQHNDQELALQYYQHVATGNTLGNDTDTRTSWLRDFDRAHEAFRQGDYPESAQLFRTLATTLPQANLSPDDAQYYGDNVDWNALLAQLAAGTTHSDWEQALDEIAANPAHSYHENAKRLQAER